MKRSDSREARAAGDGVDDDETFAVADRLVPESYEFHVASCVENLEHAELMIDSSLLTIRILHGWVVRFNEAVQAELFVDC